MPSPGPRPGAAVVHRSGRFSQQWNYRRKTCLVDSNRCPSARWSDRCRHLRFRNSPLLASSLLSLWASRLSMSRNKGNPWSKFVRRVDRNAISLITHEFLENPLENALSHRVVARCRLFGVEQSSRRRGCGCSVTRISAAPFPYPYGRTSRYCLPAWRQLCPRGARPAQSLSSRSSYGRGSGLRSPSFRSAPRSQREIRQAERRNRYYLRIPLALEQ
jgi:hypothetical protein